MTESIHDVIDNLRTDPAGISSKFGIPLSTVYGWCNGNRTPPVYVIGMMNTIINLERSIADGTERNRLEN